MDFYILINDLHNVAYLKLQTFIKDFISEVYRTDF